MPARRGSVAKQRVRQHAESRSGIKKDLCFHKSLVYHKGFEPLAFWSVAKRSIQLS